MSKTNLTILDIKKNASEVISNLTLRGNSYKDSINKYVAYQNKIAALNKQMEDLAFELKSTDPKDYNKLKELSTTKKELLKDIKTNQDEQKLIYLELPNVSRETVPSGTSDIDNVVKKEINFPTPTEDAKAHWEIARNLDIVGFEETSNVYGNRYISYKGQGAILVRGIINFLLDYHKKNNYKEYCLPVIVPASLLTGTGQLPKFEEDLFKVDEKYLTPTGEVGLTNLYANQILSIEDLPKLLTTYSLCFRKEVGSAGKDTKGITRLHQFNKVEIVRICKDNESDDYLEEMVKEVSGILTLLKLKHRIIELCIGDLGFSAAKTYDVEVYMPFQKTFREISSISNCTNFQAIRANIKYLDENNEKTYCHTLNGSGLAIDRLVAAIIENFQDENGNVAIPNELVKYTGFNKIEK